MPVKKFTPFVYLSLFYDVLCGTTLRRSSPYPSMSGQTTGRRCMNSGVLALRQCVFSQVGQKGLVEESVNLRDHSSAQRGKDLGS